MMLRSDSVLEACLPLADALRLGSRKWRWPLPMLVRGLTESFISIFSVTEKLSWISWSLALPWVLELLLLDRQNRREFQLRCFRLLAELVESNAILASASSIDLFGSSPALVSVSELVISAFTISIIRANVTYS